MKGEIIQAFIRENRVSESFYENALNWYVPLINRIIKHQNEAPQCFFVGINGCQGSGKSTLVSFIDFYLKKTAKSTNKPLNVVTLSLDDFYLSRQKRSELAERVHPLFQTRGVPGTHDMTLLTSTLHRLKQGDKGFSLPKFDKATDDVLPQPEWPVVDESVDLVLIEGWCWGSVPQVSSQLAQPVNTLEEQQDPDAIWRTHANWVLKETFLPLYELVDQWVMLKAPNFDCVLEWRYEQEKHLALSVTKADNKLMSKAQIKRFISYFQRLTQHTYKNTQRFDEVFILDSSRKVTSLTASEQPNILVFSDLDGTLLDHFDYNFDAAKPLLAKLENQCIPVVANTSKTFAELVELYGKLKLATPFIVENGAAVYIPIGYFREQPADTTVEGDYWVKAFVPSREHWLDHLNQLPSGLCDAFIGFSQMSSSQIAQETGLSKEEALLASKKQFSEPIKWLGNERQKQQLAIFISERGAKLLEGGRFIHIGGQSDKAHAMNWLTAQYENEYTQPVSQLQDIDATQKVSLKFETSPVNKILTVALGDSYNDNAMLEAADIAVQIKSPKHGFVKLKPCRRLIQSEQYGPEGWAETMSFLLDEFQQKCASTRS